ncbi:FAD-dependent urate hydroxylase [Mucor velutinosus]|uniref:Holocytochrome c-type synthase n=1 Tax=Mucor velutinosus TaxID=708070 RepID=A0AAN7DHH0_9FUNG|nr:FAD-dependent urate hydroxylase [Mucor velutinosus]
MSEAAKSCPVDHKQPEPALCPVDHGQKKQEEPKCPVDHNSYKHFIPPTASKNDEPQSCPVDPATYKNFLPPPKEGCDSTAIDSTNNMPKVSQQSPQPDQKMPLGKERETSTIPRANSDDKLWIYPSEQMFFNAMRRKNWNPEEKDMAVVVPIHNAVNEMAWQKILEWEKMHETECQQPMLAKFEGRPKDITPKARIRSWFGYALPFDRHDWVVDRCGEKVTYVIDFYSGKQDPNRPMSLSFYLDVRPAVSPSGVWDRLKMSFKKGSFT